MHECCGEERATPFCPMCGRRLSPTQKPSAADYAKAVKDFANIGKAQFDPFDLFREVFGKELEDFTDD